MWVYPLQKEVNSHRSSYNSPNNPTTLLWNFSQVKNMFCGVHIPKAGLNRTSFIIGRCSANKWASSQLLLSCGLSPWLQWDYLHESGKLDLSQMGTPHFILFKNMEWMSPLLSHPLQSGMQTIYHTSYSKTIQMQNYRQTIWEGITHFCFLKFFFFIN